MEFLTKALMFLTATFLILLVLVQRGRGGGLAGALGGMGGQSAFGTKAGDMFTRVTIGVAAVWIVLSCFAVWYFSAGGNEFSNVNLGANAPQTAPATTGSDGKSTPPAGEEKTAAPAAGSEKTSSEKPSSEKADSAANKGADTKPASTEPKATPATDEKPAPAKK